MKFFIISLIINIFILAIPLDTKEVINDSKKINIEIIETKIEKTIAKEEIIEQKAILKKNIKTNKNAKAIKKVQTKSNIKTKPITNTANLNEITKEIAKETTKENSNDISFCKNNVIFSELDNSYPKVAKMLKLEKISKVSVRFNITNNGINILDISGSDFFVKHTKKLILNMQYKVLNKEALGCIFVKNIEYRIS